MSIKGAKMKLYTPNKQIVKVNAGAFGPLPKSYNGQTLKICGIFSVETLTEADIARNEKAGKSLCHIDETPCLDEKMQERLKKEGKSEAVAKRHADDVRASIRDDKTSVHRTAVITLTKKPVIIDSITTP